MSDIDYSEIADLVSDAISDYGRSITLRRVTGATFDKVEGTVTGGMSTDNTTYGIAIEINKRIRDLFGEVPAEDEIYALGPDVEPKDTDSFIVGGETWRIVKIVKNSPAGIDLAYLVQVKR